VARPKRWGPCGTPKAMGTVWHAQSDGDRVARPKRLAMGVGSVANDSSDSPRPSYLRACHTGTSERATQFIARIQTTPRLTWRTFAERKAPLINHSLWACHAQTCYFRRRAMPVGESPFTAIASGGPMPKILPPSIPPLGPTSITQSQHPIKLM